MNKLPMFLDKLIKKNPKPLKAEKFFIFIESPIKVVAPQIFMWGQANWWPVQSGIQVSNVPDGQTAIGSKSTIKIKGILPTKLRAEVSHVVPDRLIERTFIKGLLKGTETIVVEERYNGTRLEVTLQAAPRNPIYQLLWPLYRDTYTQSIRKILENIKNYSLSIQRL